MFRRSTVGTGLCAAAIAMTFVLSGCAGSEGGTAPEDESTSGGSAVESQEPSEEATDTDDSESDSMGVTISGTGEYAIGTDVPIGGFQMVGEPVEQPAGCTWSIQDADGGIVAENQGAYVFFTDAAEYVTFFTEGCPDWEQFE